MLVLMGDLSISVVNKWPQELEGDVLACLGRKKAAAAAGQGKDPELLEPRRVSVCKNAGGHAALCKPEAQPTTKHTLVAVAT